MRYFSACALFLGLGFVLAALSGCGESLGNTVNGTVKTKNNKLINGTIVFVDKNGKETQAAILNGEYKATKVTAGQNDVLIKGPPGGIAPGMVTGAPIKDGKGETLDLKAQEQGVPPNKKYESKGHLTLDVASGKNDGKDFTLDD